MRCEGSGTVILRKLKDAEDRGDRILGKILRAVSASGGPAEGVKQGSGRVYEMPCPVS